MAAQPALHVPVNIPRISRAEARDRGLKRYFTGEPCKYGHVSERTTSNTKCMACDRVTYAQRSQVRRPQMRAYQEANREACRRSAKAWKDAHPESGGRYASNRRARLKAAPGEGYTREDVDRLRHLQGNRCAYCRTSLDDGFHVDHIQPIAKRGEHSPRNLQLLCPPCNQSKHAKDPIVWAQEQGWLL